MVQGGAGARTGFPTADASGARKRESLTQVGRWGGKHECAVLVGVDLAVRLRTTRQGLAGVRLSVSRTSDAKEEIGFAAPGGEDQEGAAVSTNGPGLDAEESLAEFRELVRSAGGEVAAELFQRRARPDPATLIGAGKVEEIAAVAASTQADLVLFDHDGHQGIGLAVEATIDQLRGIDEELFDVDAQPFGKSMERKGVRPSVAAQHSANLTPKSATVPRENSFFLVF